MIYLDNGATSLRKPRCVLEAVQRAMQTCANPGRGGYGASMEASRTVYAAREAAAQLFGCRSEQVVFTPGCTQGLNIAIRSLVPPGGSAVISGFEHNAVVRPLHLLGARVTVAGRRLFDWADTLESFEKALKKHPDAAIFTHVSNVFGYIEPVDALAELCTAYGVPFIVDAAQSAGTLPVRPESWGAAFVAMPGHKGLLGPQGTGLLICRAEPKVLIAGGTGSESENPDMPAYLPDRLEAGTLNVPGIAGLGAGMRFLAQRGEELSMRESQSARYCAELLKKLDVTVYSGEHQASTVSFVPKSDCEELAQRLAGSGICVRAGLHCAPLAHQSAGTLQTGTVRVSFGADASPRQAEALLQCLKRAR
ncbi:MAG: aminotransferase class V-fold PLP-dependent enzyme [Firmicutes bacterium]|nr:aminotransferase class V-fold PLP-dependent enzyme [Bacillota bacterium]